MGRADRDPEVLESLLALPRSFWEDYRPVALPPALRTQLERADAALLRTLLVEVAFRLHGQRPGQRSGKQRERA